MSGNSPARYVSVCVVITQICSACNFLACVAGGRTVKRTRSGDIDPTIPACVGEVSAQLSPLTLQRELEVRIRSSVTNLHVHSTFV